jgi:hypothetical protein
MTVEEHLNEAQRLTELAYQVPPALGPDNVDRGQIERAAILIEANNHLLWAIAAPYGADT